MFDFLTAKSGQSSPKIDLWWEQGDVGNWILRVGKVKKVAHVYKNPWSPLWIADFHAKDYSESFSTVEEAKLVVELVFRGWLDDILFVEEPDTIIFNDINSDLGF